MRRRAVDSHSNRVPVRHSSEEVEGWGSGWMRLRVAMRRRRGTRSSQSSIRTEKRTPQLGSGVDSGRRQCLAKSHRRSEKQSCSRWWWGMGVGGWASSRSLLVRTDVSTSGLENGRATARFHNLPPYPLYHSTLTQCLDAKVSSSIPLVLFRCR